MNICVAFSRSEERINFAAIFNIAMKRIVFAGLMCLAGANLIVASGCGRARSQKVVEVKRSSRRPRRHSTPWTWPSLSRSLVDAINMGEKLDSTYNFTASSPTLLRTLHPGRRASGVWDVLSTAPGASSAQRRGRSNLQAEDLRVYIAQAIGLNDNDVIDAGVVDGNEQATAVVYNRGNLRMEMTLLLDQGENVHMTVAFIRQ